MTDVTGIVQKIDKLADEWEERCGFGGLVLNHSGAIREVAHCINEGRWVDAHGWAGGLHYTITLPEGTWELIREGMER